MESAVRRARGGEGPEVLSEPALRGINPFRNRGPPASMHQNHMKVKIRRPLTRRFLLLGIAWLAVVSGFALYVWATGLPLPWTADYDRASYSRIVKAIAADPKRLCGRRLYDVARELGMDDAPWDDANVQNRPGSFRIYHFQGFALYVTLEYMRQGLTNNMLLERGSEAEKLRARNLLQINLDIPPYVLIDGLKRREERMRIYWAREEEAIREINEQMELKPRGHAG
jgi:hypothetical protein